MRKFTFNDNIYMLILYRILLFLLVVFIQWYFYQAVVTITRDFSEAKRSTIKYAYYFLSGLITCGVLAAMFFPPPMWSKYWRNYFGTTIFIFLLCQLIGAIALIPDDIIRGFRIAYAKIFSVPDLGDSGTKITRLKFFSYLGLFMAALPGAGLMYGIMRGAHHYKVHRVLLSFPNLPEAFHGMKMVQVSDIHTGSFTDTSHLEAAFEKVMEEKPDVIFFTGDLVNTLASETEGFLETYKKLQAPHGVYSVLGNHDYGDYAEFETQEEKDANLAALKKVHKEAGWKLLCNTHDVIERDEQQIAVLGIENCPHRGHFIRHRYGDMKKTCEGTEKFPFRILLSHDPSHWDKQVSVEEEYRNIDLTLSGHTHGMQFGIEIPGLKWSPVQYLYRQWAGLYKQDNQYLYVNRGLGYIGYNGRIGIRPEITVFQLYKGEPAERDLA